MTTNPILDAILKTLPDAWRGERLAIGVNWTMVILTDPAGERHAGLAAAPNDAAMNAQTEFSRGILELSGQDATALTRYVYSTNPVRASIGFAALNACLQPPPDSLADIDAADWLAAHGRGRNVAVVGHFPFLDELRPAVRQLWVLELDPRPGDFPANEASNIIPQADVVAITGSTLINHTLDDLLTLPRPGAKVMLLGPTTPLTPILFDYGVHLLSGVRVVDVEAALNGVMQGLIFRHIQGLRRVTLMSKT